jgi:hypothetical protein
MPTLVELNVHFGLPIRFGATVLEINLPLLSPVYFAIEDRLQQSTPTFQSGLKYRISEQHLVNSLPSTRRLYFYCA